MAGDHHGVVSRPFWLRYPDVESDAEVDARLTAWCVAYAIVLEPDGNDELDEVRGVAYREALVQQRREPPR